MSYYPYNVHDQAHHGSHCNPGVSNCTCDNILAPPPSHSAPQVPPSGGSAFVAESGTSDYYTRPGRALQRRLATNASAPILEDFYRSHTKFPDFEQRAQLSHVTGIDVKDIRRWFAHKRAKDPSVKPDDHRTQTPRPSAYNVLNIHQLAVLQEAFARNPSPDAAARAELAAELEISTEKVYDW